MEMGERTCTGAFDAFEVAVKTRSWVVNGAWCVLGVFADSEGGSQEMLDLVFGGSEVLGYGWVGWDEEFVKVVITN